MTTQSILNKLKELPNDQPDFIFIITDQERATQHFPFNWESEKLKTLTRLKSNGFTFDSAYCNTCMCTPSRATLFTGTYPAQHRCTQTLTEGGIYSPGEITLNPQTPHFGRMFDSIGYDVQYRGKWHLSKGVDGGDPLAKDIALFGFKGWVGPDAGEDAKPENFGAGFANHDEMYIKQTIEYLESVKKRRRNGDMTPYCLVLSLVNPHDVLAYPNNVQYGYTPDDYTTREVELPDTWDEDLLKNKKPVCQFQTNIAADGLLGVLKNQTQKLNYINFYANLLEKIDGQIGEVVDVLYGEEDKLADSAIVFRLADHGEMGMAHGGMRQKAFVAYEENMRIPMVVSNPILFPEGQKSDELATLVDIYPTVATLAGVDINSFNPDYRGVDLTTIMDGGSAQDSILFTFDDTKSGSSGLPSSVMTVNRLRSIRTKKWKYTYYFDSLGAYETQYELYYVGKDNEEKELFNDNEYTNLAYDDRFQKIRNKLHIKLKELEDKKLINNQNTAKFKKWIDTNANFETYAFNGMEEEEKETYLSNNK